VEKIIGIVPARMASSRFPGKPLHKIRGKAMVEHCFRRARMLDEWTGLFLATCDEEIRDFADSQGFPVLMTADTHTRCLDRVAEAVTKCGTPVDETDIVVCVQGDEPMLRPDMIRQVIKPMQDAPEVYGTVLAIHIVDPVQFYDPNIVKIIHDINGDVLYTSRAPVPYCKTFSPELMARRVGGIFGFRWHFLKTFTSLPESPLERVEACDSNRICDNGFRQRIAPYPHVPYFSVDVPADAQKVESALAGDPLWGTY